ncbi:MAG: hypothetical protein ACRCZD_12590 [Phycicoccus sp.]
MTLTLSVRSADSTRAVDALEGAGWAVEVDDLSSSPTVRAIRATRLLPGIDDGRFSTRRVCLDVLGLLHRAEVEQVDPAVVWGPTRRPPSGRFWVPEWPSDAEKHAKLKGQREAAARLAVFTSDKASAKAAYSALLGLPEDISVVDADTVRRQAAVRWLFFATFLVACVAVGASVMISGAYPWGWALVTPLALVLIPVAAHLATFDQTQTTSRRLDLPQQRRWPFAAVMLGAGALCYVMGVLLSRGVADLFHQTVHASPGQLTALVIAGVGVALLAVGIDYLALRFRRPVLRPVLGSLAAVSATLPLREVYNYSFASGLGVPTVAVDLPTSTLLENHTDDLGKVLGYLTAALLMWWVASRASAMSGVVASGLFVSLAVLQIFFSMEQTHSAASKFRDGGRPTSWLTAAYCVEVTNAPSSVPAGTYLLIGASGSTPGVLLGPTRANSGPSERMDRRPSVWWGRATDSVLRVAQRELTQC